MSRLTEIFVKKKKKKKKIMATLTNGMKYPYNLSGMPLYSRIVTVNELKINYNW